LIFGENIDLSLEWELNDDYHLSDELENIINNSISDLPNMKGFIIIQSGEIIFEDYYNGSNQNESYNIYSVTKSFVSTLIGQMSDMSMIPDPDSSMSYFFPDSFLIEANYLEDFTLVNALTMSTGYVEGYPDFWWDYVNTIDLLTMDYTTPGTFFYNNSACHINSHVIFYNSGLTPYFFASSYLFPFLDIQEPWWFYGNTLGINDGSANLYLNLRQMVKLGQLYLQDGYSGEIQILGSEWIEDATSPQIEVGNQLLWPELSDYGYLWWLPEYEGSYLAYGYGGQYIAVIPQYNLVIGSHSSDNGPDEAYSHANNLRNIIFNEILLFFENDSLSVDMSLHPEKIQIKQNYPNPFNPTTTLEYYLPRDLFVNISIYDMLGNKIKSLVQRNQVSGFKSVQWNAQNNQGEPVSAGVYLYKIQADGFSQTKKMILVK
tara:strand:+ start:4325 stop:5620 length:1296 start_codon:yes stop_codon:yes gene_type:complete